MKKNSESEYKPVYYYDEKNKKCYRKVGNYIVEMNSEYKEPPKDGVCMDIKDLDSRGLNNG